MLNQFVSQLTTQQCPAGQREAPRVPDFSEPRVLADKSQRNGVILGPRFLLFGMAAPVLSVEEGARRL
jgi:hypothetical protein